jgi:hypothetical protein
MFEGIYNFDACHIMKQNNPLCFKLLQFHENAVDFFIDHAIN